MTNFYRTLITLEILTDDGPLPPHIRLADIEYQTTEGGWSGRWEIIKSEELSGPEMARALLDQGSEPEFFQLSENGRSLLDGTEGQDRENYTDTQDRDNYTVDEDCQEF